MLMLAMAGAARAGTFEVSPVRTTLTADQPIAAFVVRNAGVRPTTIEVSLVRWSQRHGHDVYAATRELLASPPLFRLGPGEEQTVRVGMLHRAAGPREEAYRMFLTEVPPPPAPGFHGLAIALRLSIPVFVRGRTPVAPAVSWRLVRGTGRALLVEADDTGTGHVKINGLRLYAGRGDRPIGSATLATYLLPGQAHDWRIATVRPVPAGTTVRIRAATDCGKMEGGAQVSVP